MKTHTKANMAMLAYFQSIQDDVEDYLKTQPETSRQDFVRRYGTGMSETVWETLTTQIDLMESFEDEGMLGQVFPDGDKTTAKKVVDHFFSEFRSASRSTSPTSVQDVGEGHSCRKRSLVDYKESTLADKELNEAKREAALAAAREAARPKKKRRTQKSLDDPEGPPKPLAGDVNLMSYSEDDSDAQKQSIVDANFKTVLETCRRVVKENQRLRTENQRLRAQVRQLLTKQQSPEPAPAPDPAPDPAPAPEPAADLPAADPPEPAPAADLSAPAPENFLDQLRYALLHCPPGKAPEGLLERFDCPNSKYTVIGATRIDKDTKKVTEFAAPVADGNFHGDASVPILCPTAWLEPGTLKEGSITVPDNVFCDDQGVPCVWLLTPVVKQAIVEEMLHEKPRRAEEPCAEYVQQWDQQSVDWLVHGWLRKKALEIRSCRTMNDFNAFTNRVVLNPVEEMHMETLAKVMLVYNEDERASWTRSCTVLSSVGTKKSMQ